jgi:hypothetical protein
MQLPRLPEISASVALGSRSALFPNLEEGSIGVIAPGRTVALDARLTERNEYVSETDCSAMKGDHWSTNHAYLRSLMSTCGLTDISVHKQKEQDRRNRTIE